MQSYTELIPPTAATHSLSLPFLSSSANNLIVVKTSLLQIFSLKSTISDVDSAVEQKTVQNLQYLTKHGQNDVQSAIPNSGTPGVRGERIHTTKLILLAQYECAGTITSIARVKILRSKSGGDAVLISLRDAKLSLIEWDPERYSISTISIHYYEREDLQGSPWGPDPGQCVNYLSVDPSSRCAALKFGVRHLAILPFHQAGDELVIDDYDPSFDGEKLESSIHVFKTAETVNAGEKTPYAASFVLSLLALDPGLSHPVHLSFLYEYREPTFGIISAQSAISTALLHERRDTISYTVFTLDLEQRASTTLLTVNNLPYDLFKVMPLPLPVGGALLVGGNEIIHVDQAGKTNGVAVNSFAKQSTTFAMLDQSELAMRLEYCVVEQLGIDSRELLIILNTGELAIVSFKTDGRSVSGLSVRRLTQENGGAVIPTGPSCASMIGRGRIFVGSEYADSVILGWSRRSDKLKRQRSRVNLDDEEASELDEDDIEDDDDDLYSSNKLEDKVTEQPNLLSNAGSMDDYVFRVHDSLPNIGPIKDIVLRKFSHIRLRDTNIAKDSSRLELLVSSGCSRAGGLTNIRKKIQPRIIEQFDVPILAGIWTVCTRQNLEETSTIGNKGEKSLSIGFDKYMIVSRTTETGEEQSNAYEFTSTGLTEVIGTDFDPEAGATVEVGILNGGTRIVQVLPGELRTFDGEFGLAQIVPMTDDTTGAEPKVYSAAFADPYVLLIRDDSSLMILKAEESGDLEEIDRGGVLLENRWLSGSLYEDSNDTLRLETEDDSDDEAGNVLMFLLNDEGGLEVFRLPNLKKPIYVADGLSFLPPFLSPEFTVRRSLAKENLNEILVAELGDSVYKSPYLIVRSANEDLIIYQPYQSPLPESSETALRFLKVLTSHIPDLDPSRASENVLKRRHRPLSLVQDLDKSNVVFVPGASASLIFKSASSPPQVIKLEDGGIYGLSRLHTSTCEKGFVYVDDHGLLYAAQLPLDSQYSTGWVTRKISLGEEIQAFDFHEGKQAYVIGTNHQTNFKLPEEDPQIGSNDDDLQFSPQVDQGSIRLLDHKTWLIIDNYDLDPTEVIMCIKTMSLETSEISPLRKELVVVGTTLVRGEDLSCQGRIYIFDVIDVVPEPDHPETGLKLKLIAKEEVKGAVTALSEIGSQGFLLAAQGQKCMVRGLKDDGTLMPVAFMDMQCYVTVAKELKGTSLCMMADAVKGVWFTGYYEDPPYQLRLFSKSPHPIEVIAADFLPDGKQLYLVVADADCNLHILQFDPDNPKSLSGQRLLHLTTFHTGHYPTTLTLLPASPSQSQPQPRSLLLTASSGAIALVSALPPTSHRTLAALQSHLQNTLPHPLGLNPKAYRDAGRDVGGAGAGVVDGGLVRRWVEGGSWRRWEGGGGEGVRGLVGGLGGRGIF